MLELHDPSTITANQIVRKNRFWEEPRCKNMEKRRRWRPVRRSKVTTTYMYIHICNRQPPGAILPTKSQTRQHPLVYSTPSQVPHLVATQLHKTFPCLPQNTLKHAKYSNIQLREGGTAERRHPQHPLTRWIALHISWYVMFILYYDDDCLVRDVGVFYP